MKKKWIVITIMALLVFGLGTGFGIYHASRAQSSVTQTSNSQSVALQSKKKESKWPSTPDIDGISCQSMEGSQKHIHVHLDIYQNGEKVTIPAETGIRPDNKCLYWLHTHDDSGVIHVESPIEKTFTLGQFFDVWNQYPQTKTFQKVYVNGKLNTGNFRNIPLRSHEEIVLEDGPTFVAPETSYTFPQGE